MRWTSAYFVKNKIQNYEINIKLINNVSDKTNILNKNWFYFLIKEMITKILSNRTDLHFGNIRISQNEQLRFFDPAYSSNSQLSNNNILSTPNKQQNINKDISKDISKNDINKTKKMPNKTVKIPYNIW